MSWLRPDWLWFLIPAAALPLIVELFARRRVRRDFARFAGERALKKRPPRVGRYRLLGLAFLPVVLALAGPRWGHRLVESPLHGIDLMVVLDASRSMKVQDLAPDRIGRAQRELFDLAERFDAGRLGLIVFGGSGELLCPLTHDRAGFLTFARDVDPLLTAEGGTSIGAGLDRALAALDSKSPVDKVILLLTDGENLKQDERLSAASWKAYSRGVVIHTVLIGTASGGPVPADPEDGGGFVRDERGQPVISRADGDLLRRIAERTGGLFLSAESVPFPVARLVRERLSDLKLSSTGQALRLQPVDRSGWFLTLAFVLLLLPFLRETWRALSARVRIPVLPLVFVAPLLLGGSGALDFAREGLSRFERGEFQAARESFEQAFQRDPDSAAIGFDLAACSYALGRYEQAARDFDRARRLARPPLLAKAAFGAGLARARQAAQIAEQAGRERSDLASAVLLLRESKLDFVEALRAGYGRPAAVNLELVTRSLRDLRRRLEAEPDGGEGRGERDSGAEPPPEPKTGSGEQQSSGEDQGQDPNQSNRPAQANRERDASGEGTANAPAEPSSRLPGGLFREEAGQLEEIVRRYDRERRQYDREQARRGRARTERDW